MTERLPHGSQHRKTVGVHVDVTPSSSAPSPDRRQPWRQWHPRTAAKRAAETCSPRTGAPPANLRRPGPQGGEGDLEPLARLLHQPDSSHPPGHRSRGRATEPATPSPAPERRTAADDRSLAASAQLIGPALNKASPYSKLRALPASGFCGSGRSNVTTALHMITTHRMY